MTRRELATWCVNVTEPKETEIPTETPIEAAKAAYKAKQNASRVLAEAVREARKQHSLAEIATELGISRQRIHQISQNNEEQS